MKLKVIALLVIGTASGFGTVVNVDTGGGEAALSIVDNAGQSVVGSAFAVLGTWDGTPLGPGSTPVDFAAVFSAGSYSPVVAIETFTGFFGSADGYALLNVSKSAVAAAGDTGKRIAVALYKGVGDIGQASEAILVAFDATYDDPGVATPQSLNHFDSPGEVVYGSADRAMMAVLVPEPSSALLLGLGALGFLVRRKR